MTLAQFLAVHQLTFSFSHLPVAMLRGQKGDQSNHDLCLSNSQSVNGILGILPVSACIIQFGKKSKKSVTEIYFLSYKSLETHPRSCFTYSHAYLMLRGRHGNKKFSCFISFAYVFWSLELVSGPYTCQANAKQHPQQAL